MKNKRCRTDTRSSATGTVPTASRGAAARGKVIELARKKNAMPSPCCGRVIGFDGNRPLVTSDGLDPRGVPARFAGSMDRESLDRAIARGSEMLLVFENSDPDLPIIVDTIRDTCEAEIGDDRQTGNRTACLKGDHVVLEANKSIVLKTARGSITLHRNGKIVVRGMEIETRSLGKHRIKGAMVQIN